MRIWRNISYTFILICVFVFVFFAYGQSISVGDEAYVVQCYITAEPTDGLEHEFYYVGDTIYLVAHILIDGDLPAATDLGSSETGFDITWYISRDGETWETLGAGERFELVLDAETARSYYKFVATQKEI